MTDTSFPSTAAHLRSSINRYIAPGLFFALLVGIIQAPLVLRLNSHVVAGRLMIHSKYYGSYPPLHRLCSRHIRTLSTRPMSSIRKAGTWPAGHNRPGI